MNGFTLFLTVNDRDGPIEQLLFRKITDLDYENTVKVFKQLTSTPYASLTVSFLSTWQGLGISMNVMSLNDSHS